ncbi:MAG: MarR family transcriptional regulator [Flavobacteriales bacterium]|nr:MarR family transcriptional regulator [Flavobacteriales bacterium]MBK6945137.1 MarR family transcriptional regulator [Flavobacteriales bacterium]MBK7239486.1 MarR family transcriptional regulator [Flavobacteriales bacterium]MBK7296029.1 MarR family transcriptional regulator [Flavobacteriales bacterium]MBK9535309.1 MarR family transcriptional regulator [Flavobacteriales bacterium]
MPKISVELRSKFESEQQKAMLNTMFTANWLRSKAVERFRSFGLSPEQYNILRILRGGKGKMKMHDVRDRMIDRAPNTTRLTDKLVIKDLVHRERCESDRRVVFVNITKSGLALLEEIDLAMKAEARSDQEKLSNKEASMLNGILDKWRG